MSALPPLSDASAVDLLGWTGQINGNAKHRFGRTACDDSQKQCVIAIGRLDKNLCLIEFARSLFEISNACVPFRGSLGQVAVKGKALTVQSGSHERQHNG